MSDKVPLGLSEILEVVAAFEAADWDEIHLASGGAEIHVSTGARKGSAPLAPRPVAAPAAAPAASAAVAAVAETPPAPVELEPGTITVHAPSVGIFWRSPKPGAPPFVEVGDEVPADQTLCIIEVMKLMTNLTPGSPGRITSILVANGEQIVQGQPLLTLLP